MLTIVSLLIALAGSFIGFAVACSAFMRAAPALGGAAVGLAISLMHYTGMAAYRVEGLVTHPRHGFVSPAVFIPLA